MQTPGEIGADAGGEQSARDSRLGCGPEAGPGMALRIYACAPVEPFCPSPDA